MDEAMQKGFGQDGRLKDTAITSVKRPEPARSRLPEFEFGRLRVPDEETHRLLLKAGQGGSY